MQTIASMMMLAIALALCTSVTSTPASPPAAIDTSIPLPTIYWRVRLQNSVNTTFGVPTISNGILAVYAIDVPARSTLLCVIDITGGAAYPTVLYKLPVPFVEEASGWIAAGWTGTKQSGVLALFAGSMAAITAYNAKTGDVLWVRSFPKQLVSAHPTYYDGNVYVAYENGVLSYPVVVISAATGDTIWQVTDAAFTLIWPIYSDVLKRALVVYCGIDTAHAPPGETGIVLYARDAYTGDIAWTIRNMTTTELNNNPNLVVGSGPKGVYMYSKPIHDLRIVTLHETATGKVLWSLPAHGDIDDYDTFTWQRDFYRLVTVNATWFSLESIDESMSIRWTTYFGSVDNNVNILVGGKAAMTVGLQANQVNAFSSSNGQQLWQWNVPRPNDGNVDDKTQILYLGDGEGYFYAVSTAAPTTATATATIAIA